MNSTVTDGLNPNTSKNIRAYAGAVYKNWGTENEELIGVSAPNEFNVKPKFYTPQVSPFSTNVKGFHYLTDVTATLKCTFIETSEDILKMGILGDIDSSDPTYDTIATNPITGMANNYLDNVALVGRISGSNTPVVIILDNVLNIDGFDSKADNGKDNTIELTFTAHLDPATPNTLPYRILYPKDNVTSNSENTPNPLTFTANPANTATGVADSISPVLTFSNQIAANAVTIVKTNGSTVVPASVSFDSTGTVLTISPTSALTAATGYSLIIAGVKDIYGQTLSTSVVTFTTA